MSKRHYRWLALALVVLLIGFGVMRALSARKAQQQAVAAASVAKAQTEVTQAANTVKTTAESVGKRVADGFAVLGSQVGHAHRQLLIGFGVDEPRIADAGQQAQNRVRADLEPNSGNADLRIHHPRDALQARDGRICAERPSALQLPGVP